MPGYGRICILPFDVNNTSPLPKLTISFLDIGTPLISIILNPSVSFAPIFFAERSAVRLSRTLSALFFAKPDAELSAFSNFGLSSKVCSNKFTFPLYFLP